MVKNNTQIFFETPQDKWKVFQSPELVMLSEKKEVIRRWRDTQPFYFYPFSWLDYINREGIREVCVINSSAQAIDAGLRLLKTPGKVHFEYPDVDAINLAKNKGHKVSVICELKDLNLDHVSALSNTDFVKVRVNPKENLQKIVDLPNDSLLSCVKVYVGEDHNYGNLAAQAKDMSINVFQVAKRLVTDNNISVQEREKESIRSLKQLESNRFKIVLPSSLDKVYAERFKINPIYGNNYDCLFAGHRAVLYNDKFYPCYTQVILDSNKFGTNSIDKVIGRKADCLDCACIYENDMFLDIRRERGKNKSAKFALEYVKNGS
jgi:hypothetical protein